MAQAQRLLRSAVGAGMPGPLLYGIAAITDRSRADMSGPYREAGAHGNRTQMDGHGLAGGASQLETIRWIKGYISVRPTVRIRREALQGGRTALVLCFKGAGTGLSRGRSKPKSTPNCSQSSSI